MKEADIRTYASLMKELDLTALEITEEGCTVRMERSQPVAVREPVVLRTDVPMAEAAVPSVTDGAVSIKSPIVGVFYAAPAENAEPFVSIGDRVQKGQTLCIIEAMKLLNEIEAETSGTVKEICVENGQPVEFGQTLFIIG